MKYALYKIKYIVATSMHLEICVIPFAFRDQQSWINDVEIKWNMQSIS